MCNAFFRPPDGASDGVTAARVCAPPLKCGTGSDENKFKLVSVAVHALTLGRAKSRRPFCEVLVIFFLKN